MSKFKFTGAPSVGYDVSVDGVSLGRVVKTSRYGYAYWRVLGDQHDLIFTTRDQAASRLEFVLRLLAGDAVVASALPADPFDGVSA